MRPLFLLALAPLAACSPQNATVTSGSWTAFLAGNSSQSLFEGAVDLDGADTSYAIDCVNDEDDRLDGALNICGDDLWPPIHEEWLAVDAYEVLQGDLEPWRGEAVITSEGDLQLGFHQRVPGGGNFRFAFVVNPAFNPTNCVQTGDGVEARPVDGQNWVDAWSEGRDGTTFYLNSGAYQFNPSNTEELWILPQRWRAGYSAGKFVSEDLTSRRVRYGLPAAYAAFELDEFTSVNPSDLFYVGLAAGEDPSQSAAYQGAVGQVEAIADHVSAELDLVGVDLTPEVHDNAWRIPNEQSAGLDNWVELHYTWVRFDQDPEDLIVGNPASGEFVLTFDAQQSQSRVFVQGEFEISRIKRDRWVTDDLQEVKLEESGTVLCEED